MQRGPRLRGISFCVTHSVSRGTKQEAKRGSVQSCSSFICSWRGVRVVDAAHQPWRCHWGEAVSFVLRECTAWRHGPHLRHQCVLAHCALEPAQANTSTRTYGAVYMGLCIPQHKRTHVHSRTSQARSGWGLSRSFEVKLSHAPLGLVMGCSAPCPTQACRVARRGRRKHSAPLCPLPSAPQYIHRDSKHARCVAAPSECQPAVPFYSPVPCHEWAHGPRDGLTLD